MIYCEEKLTDWTEDLIKASGGAEALNSAKSWRLLKGNVSGAKSIVRIQVFSLQYLTTMQEMEAERDVEFEIQFLVLPSDGSIFAFEKARNDSYEMFKQWKREIIEDSDLGGTVCEVVHDDKVYIDSANIEGADYGATYAYGRVNPD